MHAIKHFKTITRHRHKVIANCFRAGIGWQGLRHDLSKYTPTEFIPGEPGVLLDGGHNPEGVDGLAEAVQFYTNGQMPVFAVTGMISTKDFGYCIRRIAGFSRKVLTVDDFASNAVDAGELAAVAGDNAEAVGSLAEAYKQARSLAGECGGMVVVCGSLYLVSEFAGSDLYRGEGK